MNFSVLMSVYYKENAEFFNLSMQSIYDDQKIKPTEIVLVKDGSLTDELDKCISYWENKLGNILKIVSLEKNVGLGDALNEGLKHCSCELVARMDTDDISLPDRFFKQIEIFNKYSDIHVCSSWIAEFSDSYDNIVSYRKVPEIHEDILKFAKNRSPINHPCVMFKKDAVLKSGSYQKMLFFEDYYLWVRMILCGYKFYNIQEPLLKYRAGYDQILRRHGLKYAIFEFKFHLKLYNMKFINLTIFLMNSSIKFIIRLLPVFLLRFIYGLLR